jgi:AraC family transcriptional regulator of adaptative response/methylated-DNA-[protein]-cysteine methyltransferase
MTDIETIRYARSMSSLGDFIAAWGESGLVAFGFVDRARDPVGDLRGAFPNATVVEDTEGLAAPIAKLARAVDYPAEDAGVSLDLRGSDYQKRVWTLLREISAGTTVSYGELAARMGTRDARDVTEAIAANPIAILVPCHRVIKKDGSISGYRWGVARKRALLVREQAAARFRLAG